jgi:outer membrane protein W
VGLEGNLRIPRGKFEPYVLIGAGYASASSFKGEQAVLDLGSKQNDVAAKGVNARLGGGFDYFITPVLSAGVRADAEFLFLSRPAVVTIEDSDSIYEKDGSGIGLSASALAALGLHF